VFLLTLFALPLAAAQSHDGRSPSSPPIHELPSGPTLSRAKSLPGLYLLSPISFSLGSSFFFNSELTVIAGVSSLPQREPLPSVIGLSPEGIVDVSRPPSPEPPVLDESIRVHIRRSRTSPSASGGRFPPAVMPYFTSLISFIGVPRRFFRPDALFPFLEKF